MDARVSPPRPPRGLLARLRAWQRRSPIRPRRALGRLARGLGSSLARRILVLNLAGLGALLVGFLYLNQLREGLIEAKTQGLLAQGEIMAAAVAASGTVESDVIALDLDKLLQLQAGESTPAEESAGLEFSINPERVAPLLRRLTAPTRTRARVYDREGALLLDSRDLFGRGDVLRMELPPPRRGEPGWAERAWAWLRALTTPRRAPALEDFARVNGNTLPEVAQALAGRTASIVRADAAGATIVSVAAPVQRFRTTQGALLLSTRAGDIDAILDAERLAMLRVFLVASLVMATLSLGLANTIAGPIRRLAEAAERVRRGIKTRQEIPDYTHRHDEIGHLSGALRDMTRALYRRLDAIESFAADVSHELKNPLTSLRSAVETLPLARDEAGRGRLLEVIRHDVRRLDRLISDISDASRLDAELARAEAEPVDLAKLLTTVVSVTEDTRRDGEVAVDLAIAPHPAGESAYYVDGHDGRLGQVAANLLDNARSFSPPGAPVRAGLARRGDTIELTVEDSGPGIPDHALERVFERFYTDRPDQGFGQHSGLGLSISRQIAEAHGGTIRAERGEDGGARFTVSLPAMAKG